jgi:hypothetical protein
MDVAKLLKLIHVTQHVYVCRVDSSLAFSRMLLLRLSCSTCTLNSSFGSPKHLRRSRCLLPVQPCFPSGATRLLALSQPAHLCRLSVRIMKTSQWDLRLSCGPPIVLGPQMSTMSRHVGQAPVLATEQTIPSVRLECGPSYQLTQRRMY